MDFSKNCLLKRHFFPQFNFAWPKSVARTDYKCCGVSKKRTIFTQNEKDPLLIWTLFFAFCNFSNWKYVVWNPLKANSKESELEVAHIRRCSCEGSSRNSFEARPNAPRLYISSMDNRFVRLGISVREDGLSWNESSFAKKQGRCQSADATQGTRRVIRSGKWYVTMRYSSTPHFMYIGFFVIAKISQKYWMSIYFLNSNRRPSLDQSQC